MATMISAPPVEQRALSTAAIAKAVTITTIEDRERAAELGRTVAALDKEAEEFFAPMKESAHKTHREICNKENSVRTPLAEAKKYLAGLIGKFDTELERQRREEEKRLQEEADRNAEKEARRVSEETAIADAIQLEAEGDKVGAEAVLNNPVPVTYRAPAVILPKAVPTVAGVSTQTRWKFRITNEDEVPREYLMVDEKAIAGVVASLKNKTNIPGVEVYPETNARFRA